MSVSPWLEEVMAEAAVIQKEEAAVPTSR